MLFEQVEPESTKVNERLVLGSAPGGLSVASWVDSSNRIGKRTTGYLSVALRYSAAVAARCP